MGSPGPLDPTRAIDDRKDDRGERDGQRRVHLQRAEGVGDEILRLVQALGLGKDTVINPSGGPLAANPIMATGLVRIAEAAGQIRDNGKHRTLGHSTSGPCLQQNLVCVLEGGN